MSAGTQRTLGSNETKQTWDHERYLDQDQRRWIRKHIEIVEEMCAVATPFKISHIDERYQLERTTTSSCPVIHTVSDGEDSASYCLDKGVRDYAQEWLAQEREFRCCDYPDAFVTRADGLYCKYCGTELERETVREANL